MPSPNGVALSADERVLYLGVTRANQVWRVPLLDDGSVANPGLGLCWVLSARAEPEAVLKSSTGTSLTNVAFGGPLRRTLFCTESVTGTVLRAELEHTGLPIHRGLRPAQG